MDIILDTNVLLSGLRSRNGASFAVLEGIANGQFRLMLTTALFLEYEDVLKRSEQINAHSFSLEEIDELLSELAALAIAVDVLFQWRPQTMDPADEMVIEAAVNARVDAIVSHNIKHLDTAVRRFGIPVFRPREILTRIAR